MDGVDLSGVSVALVMPHRDFNDITVPTSMSISGTINLLHAYGVPFVEHRYIGGVLPATRSWAVKKFLTTDMNRMFWLDSDIVWEPEDFMKVLALSTKYEAVGASYRAKRDPPFYLAHVKPDALQINEDGLMPVVGMGLGFTCISRNVMQTLSLRAPKVKHLHDKEPFPQVFRFDEIGGEFQGEDMAFFQDIRGLGVPTYMDPGIELGHIGLKDFRGRFANVLQKEMPVAAE